MKYYQIPALCILLILPSLIVQAQEETDLGRYYFSQAAFSDAKVYEFEDVETGDFNYYWIEASEDDGARFLRTRVFGSDYYELSDILEKRERDGYHLNSAIFYEFNKEGLEEKFEAEIIEDMLIPDQALEGAEWGFSISFGDDEFSKEERTRRTFTGFQEIDLDGRLSKCAVIREDINIDILDEGSSYNFVEEQFLYFKAGKGLVRIQQIVDGEQVGDLKLSRIMELKEFKKERRYNFGGE